MKAYLGISRSNRKLLDHEVQQLKSFFAKNNIELEVFVDQYSFAADQEKEMMQTAFTAIDNCAYFVAELSKKAIGVGVEVGYAFAKKKPIVYLKKKEAPYSTTVAGCANFIIEYEEIKDTFPQLGNFIK